MVQPMTGDHISRPRDFFYRSRRFDLGLNDLESMSRAELLLLYADINQQITSLNDQIQSAVSRYTSTGERSDPEWFRRVKAKRAIVVAFYSHVCSALAISKGAPPANEPKVPAEPAAMEDGVRRVRKRPSALVDQASQGSQDELASLLAKEILSRFSAGDIARILVETRQS